MFTTCRIAIAQSDLRTCEPLGLSLADWATIIGLVVVLLGGLKFVGAPVARLFGWTGRTKFRSFRGLRKAVRPLALDNKRIFRTFGPKSGAGDDGLESFDLAAWYQARLIMNQNNQKILHILHGNNNLIPPRHQAVFTDWINHIQAFSAHLEDSSVDYRNHQFPTEIDTILEL